jgi:hypothetical protein
VRQARAANAVPRVTHQRSAKSAAKRHRQQNKARRPRSAQQHAARARVERERSRKVGLKPRTLGLASRRGHVAPKSIQARKPGALWSLEASARGDAKLREATRDNPESRAGGERGRRELRMRSRGSPTNVARRVRQSVTANKARHGDQDPCSSAPREGAWSEREAEKSA